MKTAISILFSLNILISVYGQDNIIYFDFNSSQIRLNDKYKLDELVNSENKTDNSLFRIVGHTDTVGDDNFNLKLSKNRVEAIKNYLVKNGIPADKIIIAYDGERKPVSTENFFNRRVEIFTNRNKEYSSLEEFMISLQPEKEIIVLNPKVENVFEGRKGIRVKIPAGVFVNSKGVEIKDSVRIELTEFTSVSDFISCRLNTISYNNLIISEGMINIKSYVENNELSLKKGSVIELGFPKSVNEKFNTFYADTTKEGNINWTQDTSAISKLSNSKTPDVTITPDGKLIVLDKTLTDSLNKRMVFNSTSNKFRTLSDMELIELANYIQEQKKIDENINKYYQVINSSKLTFINCDRFPINNRNNPIVTFKVKVLNENKTNCRAFLIFKNIKSVVSLNYNLDSYFLEARIPINGPVYLFVFGVEEERVYSFTKEISLSKVNYESISLEEDSFDRIEKYLKSF